MSRGRGQGRDGGEGSSKTAEGGGQAGGGDHLLYIMLSNTADIFHQAQVLSEKTKLKQMDDDMEGILSSINSI